MILFGYIANTFTCIYFKCKKKCMHVYINKFIYACSLTVPVVFEYILKNKTKSMKYECKNI